MSISKANGTWTTAADSLRIGATSGAAIDVTMDDVFVDTTATAISAAAIATPGSATSALTATTTNTGRGLFVCLLS